MASEQTLAKREKRDATKIEQLADAIENLALGLASKMTATQPSDMVEKFVKDARVELRTALRVFMAPNLCLVEPNQPYPQDVPETDQVTCSSCKKHIACTPNCFFWHKALRDSIVDPEAPPPAPVEPPPRPKRAA